MSLQTSLIWRYFIVIILIAPVLQACTQKNSTSMDSKHKYTNDLIDETSPYLLQHAHNPVNWMPWNEKTLQKAKEENKLMIISVGYAACHWCHVMEHESFEDEEVAAIMNEHFISVKVDREQRPDVDDVYMTACQLITGRGGWPLNAVALSDGRPIFAGTYFPKNEWVKILNQIIDLSQNKMDKLEKSAEDITAGIASSDLVETAPDGDFTKEGFNEILGHILSRIDYKDGGNDRTPRFPMPNNFELILKYYWMTQDSRALQATKITLNKMANGGIYDQLGGGFARYSVDGVWKVPHFEKMLYDNAQLIGLYADGYKVTKDPYYREVIEQTYGFLERELKDEKGVYYSSLDADSEGEEGKFYVWKTEELDSLLGKNAKLYKEYYSCSPKGNWEHVNILHITQDEEQIAKNNGVSLEDLKSIIAESNAKLMSERDNRIRPGLDDKVLNSWNGLLIDGYLRAYEALGEAKYYENARHAAEFVLKTMRQEDGRLYRNYKNGKSSINAFLDDYALMIKALIKLYQTDFDENWLQEAEKLTRIVLTDFKNEEQILFYYTSAKDAPLIVRKTEQSDNVIPASTSVMAKNLFDLGNILSKPEWIEQAKVMLSLINPNMKEKTSSSFYSNWIQNSMDMVHAPFEIAIVGKEAEKIRRELSSHYLGNSIVLGSEEDSQIALLKDKYQEGETYIYVCQNKVCKFPVTTVEEALKLVVVSP